MKPLTYFIFAVLTLFFAAGVYGQRIAVITPEPSAFTTNYSNVLAENLERHLRVLDNELVAAAYASLRIETPFNQTADSAKQICPVIGCDHFLIVKAGTARRSSSKRPVYFEASAFVFLVNGRNGRLERFLLPAKQEASAAAAELALLDDAAVTASTIASAITGNSSASSAVDFDLFDSDSKVMRPAMPYRRIKPEYTTTAYLYDLKATVDVEVSIDADGSVKKIDFTRWAGFGLEESIVEAVNKMNWRPGERNGKPLPMRVLLRYNFTKVEKEPE
jgi:hypothetical protein